MMRFLYDMTNYTDRGRSPRPDNTLLDLHTPFRSYESRIQYVFEYMVQDSKSFYPNNKPKYSYLDRCSNFALHSTVPPAGTKSDCFLVYILVFVLFGFT